MRTLQLYILIILTVSVASAQVGINTNAPTAELEVIGDVKVEGSLFLENPGENNVVRGSKLLIESTDNSIKQYDIDVSKYGPINYAQMVFEQVSKDGLQDYDTKISTDNYIVSIQGYYFLETSTGRTNVMLHSLVDNLNVEGYQIYAYPNSVTKTWFIRGFGNNSEFVSSVSGSFVPVEIDLFLNVIIYRKGFISKAQNAITVEMLFSETGTAPLPPGF